jgi:hypothetical protein
LDQIAGDVFDGGEVGWRVIDSDPALVVAEESVYDPMQAVLDRPMTAADRAEKDRQQDQGGDVKSCLPLDLLAGLPRACDEDGGLRARPVVAFLQPGNRAAVIEIGMSVITL